MQITPYHRKAHYYETDQMGIIHHSNYIRWFEEARVDFMEQAGFGYARMEEEGIISPVLTVACEYKAMVRFGDEVVIRLSILSFTGAKMTIAYQVERASSGEICAVGESLHCFLNRAGRAVSLKKASRPAFETFSRLVNTGLEPPGQRCNRKG